MVGKEKNKVANIKPIYHNISTIQAESKEYCLALSRHLSKTMPLINNPNAGIESLADANGKYTYPIWMGDHMVKNTVQVIPNPEVQ